MFEEDNSCFISTDHVSRRSLATADAQEGGLALVSSDIVTTSAKFNFVDLAVSAFGRGEKMDIVK